MDTLELIQKLRLILDSSEIRAHQFMLKSNLHIDERFEVSRSIECVQLRNEIFQLIADLEDINSRP